MRMNTCEKAVKSVENFRFSSRSDLVAGSAPPTSIFIRVRWVLLQKFYFINSTFYDKSFQVNFSLSARRQQRPAAKFLLLPRVRESARTFRRLKKFCCWNFRSCCWRRRYWRWLGWRVFSVSRTQFIFAIIVAENEFCCWFVIASRCVW